MSAAVLPFSLPVQPAVEVEAEAGAQALAAQLPVGRLIEVVADRAGAQLSCAVACLRHAQARGETLAWVQREGGSLFPPDLHASGIDLDALLIVHVPARAGAHGPARAAELLLRSGGFGMVVLDLSGAERDDALSRDLAWQGRLLGLAREHGSWLVLLSAAHGQPGSLGPLVSLCIQPRRRRVAPGRFAVEHVVRKDKSGSLGPLRVEWHAGPAGLP